MPATVKLHQDFPSENLLVVVLISSRHVTGLVAGMGQALGNQTLAYKRVDVVWDTLEEIRQIEVVSEVIRRVCDSAGIVPRSVYLSRSEVSLTSRLVAGDTDFDGLLHDIGDHEMAWALRRAEEKPVGTEQELIDLIPVRWVVNGEITRTHLHESREERREAKHRFPFGERGKGLTCQALQIIARRGYRAELERLAAGLNLDLDGVIAQPAALYRGISGTLPNRGWSLVIDCGARHTSFLLRSHERLLNVRTFEFGGDVLTERLAKDLDLTFGRAQDLKHGLDITIGSSVANQGQQSIFSTVEAGDDVLRAQAAGTCARLVREFFTERARELQDDADNPLPRKGTIHLVGNASRLGGLAPVLADIFGLDVVLGSGKGDREIGAELEGLLLTGLMVSAIDQRRTANELHGTTMSGKAMGVWAWLTRRFE